MAPHKFYGREIPEIVIIVPGHRQFLFINL
jgi:hypothetical protein